MAVHELRTKFKKKAKVLSRSPKKKKAKKAGTRHNTGHGGSAQRKKRVK